MRIESSGHSQGNPRLYELIENAPKTGKSPTVWAWPQLVDHLKAAGPPVPQPTSAAGNATPPARANGLPTPGGFLPVSFFPLN